MSKRISIGRRKVDLLLPVGFFILFLLALSWGIYQLWKRSELEDINKMLTEQVRLQERSLRNLRLKNLKNRKTEKARNGSTF